MKPPGLKGEWSKPESVTVNAAGVPTYTWTWAAWPEEHAPAEEQEAMSTGADNKTMPVTPAYADNHERIFGKRPVQRGAFVMRCSACDGVSFPPDARLYMCPRCKGWTYGSVDIAVAPPPPEMALNAPVLSGRFYEDAAQSPVDGSPINSRAKHREHMHRHGLTMAGDYSGTWKKAEQDRLRARTPEASGRDSRARKETLGRALYELRRK